MEKDGILILAGMAGFVILIVIAILYFTGVMFPSEKTIPEIDPSIDSVYAQIDEYNDTHCSTMEIKNLTIKGKVLVCDLTKYNWVVDQKGFGDPQYIYYEILPEDLQYKYDSNINNTKITMLFLTDQYKSSASQGYVPENEKGTSSAEITASADDYTTGYVVMYWPEKKIVGKCFVSAKSSFSEHSASGTSGNPKESLKSWLTSLPRT